MIRDLFRPWRRIGATWRALAHIGVGLPVGVIGFVFVFSLLVTSAATAIIVPVGIAVSWLLFVVAFGFGRVERTRFAALLDEDIAAPHAPLPTGSWWAHWKARITSASRWREIGYFLARLPLSVVDFVAVWVLWCGSAALLALPFYAGSLPGGTAKFWLFEISPGASAFGLAAVGLVGLLVLAPWATVLLARFDAFVARNLLGLRRRDQLEARVEQLGVSRAAAVYSADTERRRIERDLHDGAQQRLVALGMDLGRAREQYPHDPDRAMALVADAHEEAKAALVELRELVRGIHPAILEDRGLDAALSSVIARSPVPVTLDVHVEERPPGPVESTAYFVVAEALTNVAKHSGATRAAVSIAREGDRLVIDVTDDGRGGADASAGTGLLGLSDRVAALGGRMRILSPSGGPTTLLVELPCAS